MTTQFAILVGDNMPDYTSDRMMCIYVVGYVFICTLALLNFLLAIVVNGYTKVSEAALENTIVTSLGKDMMRSWADQLRWRLRPSRRKWPSKHSILNRMTEVYGPCMADYNPYNAHPLSCDDFTVMLQGKSLPEGHDAAASPKSPKSPLSKADAAALFDHLYELECLRVQAPPDTPFQYS